MYWPTSPWHGNADTDLSGNGLFDLVGGYYLETSYNYILPGY